MSDLKSDWFDLGEPTTAGAAAGGGRPAFAEGTGYRVEERGAAFSLSYLSGGHGGGDRNVGITSEEAHALRDGDTTLDAVLIAHGVS